jgi:hypothetical protein
LVIEMAGFSDIQVDQRQPGGVEVNFTARDLGGRLWFFEVSGGFTNYRPGLERTEALWKTLGKAAVLHEVGSTPLVVLTTSVPKRGAGAEALGALVGANKPIFAVVEMLDPMGVERLRALCGTRQPT